MTSLDYSTDAEVIAAVTENVAIDRQLLKLRLLDGDTQLGVLSILS